MEIAKTLDSAIFYMSSFRHSESTFFSETELEGRNLSEDLIVEILVKLPAKSLLRFRCVCKSWFHLIKSPNFVKRHLDNQKHKDNILVVQLSVGLFSSGNRISFYSHARPERVMSLLSYEPFGVITPPLEGIPHSRDVLPENVCGYCDGLLCLSTRWSSTIVLFSPAIREFKKLPPFPFVRRERWGPEALGFGFDSITNDYKVIVILKFHDIKGRNVEKALVYSLSSKTWRVIDRDIGWICIDSYGGTLLNGTVHWTEFQGDKIILFDMNTEVFSETKLPHIDPEKDLEKRLIVLNGSLALFTYKRTNQPWVINIWIMHEYGMTESWTKQYVIGPLTELLRPLFLWKNEAIIFGDYNAGMFSVSLDTHTMKSFNLHGILGSINLAAVYQESLISIK